MIKGFKEFILRGNVIDLAVADGEVAVTGDPAMAAEVVTALALVGPS